MFSRPEGNVQSAPGTAAQGRSIYHSYMGNSHQKEPVFEELVRQLGELLPTEILLQQIRSTRLPQNTLTQALRTLASGPDASRIFDPKSIVDNYEHLPSILGQELFLTLQSESVKSGKLCAELVARSFAVQFSALYHLLLDSGGGQNVRNHIIKGLQSVSKQDWLQALAAGSEPTALLIALHDMGATVELDLRFHDALSQCADQALAGTAPKLAREDLEKLLDILTRDQLETLERHLTEEVAEAHTSLGVFLKYFPRTVDDCHLLYEVAEKLIREGFPRILQRADAAELDWMSQILKRCPGIPKKCSSASLKTLKARIEERLSAKPTDQIEKSLKEIASALGSKKSSD